MLGNIGSNTCFCLYSSALWMYSLMPVKYLSVALLSVKRIELKEILLFFSYFGVRIPIYFLFFGHCLSYFPIF